MPCPLRWKQQPTQQRHGGGLAFLLRGGDNVRSAAWRSEIPCCNRIGGAVSARELDKLCPQAKLTMSIRCIHHHFIRKQGSICPMTSTDAHHNGLKSLHYRPSIGLHFFVIQERHSRNMACTQVV